MVEEVSINYATALILCGSFQPNILGRWFAVKSLKFLAMPCLAPTWSPWQESNLRLIAPNDEFYHYTTQRKNYKLIGGMERMDSPHRRKNSADLMSLACLYKRSILPIATLRGIRPS